MRIHHEVRAARAADAADPFNEQEREAILGVLSGQVRNLVCFGFWTGPRTGELIALRWCDVDLDNRQVCIRLASINRDKIPAERLHPKTA